MLGKAGVEPESRSHGQGQRPQRGGPARRPRAPSEQLDARDAQRCAHQAEQVDPEGLVAKRHQQREDVPGQHVRRIPRGMQDAQRADAGDGFRRVAEARVARDHGREQPGAGEPGRRRPPEVGARELGQGKRFS